MKPEVQAGAYRLDAALAVLLIAGGAVFAIAIPVRTESYYIDWISGGWVGLLVGLSEAYLTVARFTDRLREGVVRLPCRRGIPDGMGGVLALLAVLGAAYLAMLTLFGSIGELAKIPLFIFNTLCGSWWGLWLVYLGALLIWAIRRGTREGRALRVQFTS